ncbi:MAG: hypothetical protein Aurels2KO_00380 [Aureliella sp.]
METQMRAIADDRRGESGKGWLPALALAIASVLAVVCGCAAEGSADRYSEAGQQAQDQDGGAANAIADEVAQPYETAHADAPELPSLADLPPIEVGDGPYTGEALAESLPPAPRMQFSLPAQPSYVIGSEPTQSAAGPKPSAPTYSSSSIRPAPKPLGLPGSLSSVATENTDSLAAAATPSPAASASVPPSMAMEASNTASAQPSAPEPQSGSEPPRRFGELARLPDIDTGAATVAAMEERRAVEAAIGLGDPAAVQTASATTPAKPEYETVSVFFATDREATADLLPGPLRLFGPAAVACMAFCGLAIGLILAQRLRFIWLTATVAAATLTTFIGHTTLIRWQQLDRLAGDTSAAFTATRFEPAPGAYPLHVGRAQLTIPPGHQKGKVESPELIRLEFTETPDKHIVLKSVRTKEHEQWYEEIGQAVAKSGGQQTPPLSSGSGAFIFVHGYNVRFDAALKRTAQLATDLNVQGPAICFSWPSQGQVAGYTIDESTVNWSAPHFEQLILDLRDKANVKSINIVAHSMGNRALLQAVERIGMRLEAFSEAASQFASAVPSKGKIIDQLILAAPDVDARTFSARYTKYLPAVAERTTMYFSAQDRALWLSQLLHGGSRVGLSGTIARLHGIDAIDIGGQELFSLGHSYYGSDPAVIDDLAAVLLDHHEPQQRRWLSQQETNAGSYWQLDRIRHAQITDATNR